MWAEVAAGIRETRRRMIARCRLDHLSAGFVGCLRVGCGPEELVFRSRPNRAR